MNAVKLLKDVLLHHGGNSTDVNSRVYSCVATWFQNQHIGYKVQTAFRRGEESKSAAKPKTRRKFKKEEKRVEQKEC